jgi:hypothetical protein
MAINGNATMDIKDTSTIVLISDSLWAVSFTHLDVMISFCFA